MALVYAPRRRRTALPSLQPPIKGVLWLRYTAPEYVRFGMVKKGKCFVCVCVCLKLVGALHCLVM